MIYLFNLKIIFTDFCQKFVILLFSHRSLLIDNILMKMFNFFLWNHQYLPSPFHVQPSWKRTPFLLVKWHLKAANATNMPFSLNKILQGKMIRFPFVAHFWPCFWASFVLLSTTNFFKRFGFFFWMNRFGFQEI